MKKQERRGGRRAGAGRPRKAPPTVPVPSAAVNWVEVDRFARVGAPEEMIVAAGLVSEEQLKDPATAERLRSAVTRGTAQKNLLLLEQIDQVGKGSRRGGGNTLALEARNRLGWDKQAENQEPPPDLTSAHARLRLTLERLAKVKTVELGRDVTAADVLAAEVIH